jgi:hypothetical protein
VFKNLKWLRLVPDQPGKGGQKTGFHSFQAQPINDTRELSGFHVYRGRWRLDYQTQAYPGITDDPNAFSSLALHAYPVPDLTNPSAIPAITLLGHHKNATDSRYWDFTHNQTRDTHSLDSVPATFLNIEGRCFVADGAREGMILDDRTPAIHAQANQNLGIVTPSQPLPNTGLGGYGTGYVHFNSPYINHPNPNNMIGTILATDYVSTQVINPGAALFYDAGAPMADGLPTVDAVSSNVTPFAATGTISINSGTSLVVLAGAVWPADYQYAGLAINFSGYSYVVLTHGPIALANGNDLQGDSIALTNIGLIILGIYDGPTLSGVPYTITGCQITMGANSTLNTNNTNPAAPPPTVAFGYSQMTASTLVQIRILANRDGAGGSFRNLGNISLGPESIDGAATGSIESITDGSIADGRKGLTSATNPWFPEDVGLPIYVDEADTSGGVLTTTIAYFSSAGYIRLAAANTSGTSIVGTGQAWWGSTPVVTDGAMGAGVQVLTSASNPFVSGDVGQPIVVEFAGDAGGTIALISTILTYTNAGQVTLAALPARAGFGAVTGARVWWRGVSVDTHVGPTYSYAWYDPETGHMSNIAPLSQVARPTAIGNYVDFAHMTPIFRIDDGYISYPTGVDALRFSHIMFFRTLSTPGSSTLYPIGSVMPYVGKVHPGSASTRGSWNPSTYHGWMGLPNNYITMTPTALGLTAPNFWMDFSTDEDLILTGGFRAPQFTNEKPMALLKGGLTEPAKIVYQAYWDRRLWAVATQDPDKIMFSCDEAQCPLGVPVESFPPTNFLRIPSVDGQVVGMKMVGDMLLITTNRWAYTVAGNNESNYRLLRVSTRMGGVGTYQISELTSDVEGQASAIYFLGRDKIVYEWVLGNYVRPISAPVQDAINSTLTDLASYQYSRVHCISAYGRRLVAISVSSWNVFTGVSFTYDVDNKVWARWTEDMGSTFSGNRSQAFATVCGGDPPVTELYAIRDLFAPSATITPRSWIRDDGAVQITSGFNTISTFPLDFDGKKIRKQIVMVNAHVSGGASGTWTCTVSPNESPSMGGTATLAPYTQDPLYSIYGPAPAPVDSATAQDLVVLTAGFKSNNVALVGYRFVCSIGTSSTATPSELYAIDIGYIDWEEPGDGDP